MPKTSKNQPPIRTGKWNPDAPLGYHWCDDYAMPDILRTGQWEAGYVTINPAYRYKRNAQPDEFALVFDLAKGGFKEYRKPSVPWNEWEYKNTKNIELWDFPGGAFLGFGVRTQKGYKRLRTMMKDAYDEPDMFPIYFVPMVTKDKLAAKVTQFPTFEEVMDKSLDENNELTFDEFDMDFEKEYEKTKQFWMTQKFPVTAYRALALREGASIHYRGAGLSWSLDEITARGVAEELDPSRDIEVLTAKIGADAINWPLTFRLWMGPMYEQEIRLKPNARIQLISPEKKMVTAAADMQTFYHGTTWEAAEQINKEGIKANKDPFGSKEFVWCTIHGGQAYEYGQSISWHEFDDPEHSAVVEFTWPYNESKPDPEHEGHGDMYRRIPSDIPRSSIKSIEYYERGKIVKTSADKKPTKENTRMFAGMPVVVEWDEGEVRHGKTEEGKEWERIMAAPYGYIKDTKGAGDKEGVDVYLGANENAPNVYVIEQLKADGSFDEFKSMLGFDTEEEATDMYCKHYPKSWRDERLGKVETFPIAEFKEAVQANRGEKTAASHPKEYSHTKEEGEHIVAAIQEMFPQMDIKLVGSVATEGGSDNDFDILITGEGFDDDSYDTLINTMAELGWKHDGVAEHDIYGTSDVFNKNFTRQWVDIWYAEGQNKTAARKLLREALEELRPVFAKEAQEAYEQGPEHNWQGVCYSVASFILEAALSRNPNWGGEVIHGTGDEHHSWAVICTRTECFKVDIPFTKYEKQVLREEVPGNLAYDSDMPYAWELLPDVEFQPSDIEITPALRPKWSSKTAARQFLYHVTPTENLSAIRQEGLHSNIESNFYDSPPGVYFTGAAGVEFWKNEVGQYFEGKPISVLRVSTANLRGLQKDEAGWEDAASPTFRAPYDIPAEHIAVQTESGWEPLEQEAALEPGELGVIASLADAVVAKTAAESVTLYHGTCEDSANSLVKNGWSPNSGGIGGNVGQSKYLYLTTEPEDALWFAEEKGCDSIVQVHAPLDALLVDPEDGTGKTVEEEIHNSLGLPGKVVLTKPLPAQNFRIRKGHKTAALDADAFVASLRYWNDVSDHHSGETFGAIYATPGEASPEAKLAARLTYSIYEDGIHIKMIEVAPDIRRRGVATKLYQKLQETYPDKKIIHGVTTPEGTEWLKSVTSSNTVSGEDVVTHAMKTSHQPWRDGKYSISREEAQQLVGLDAGGDYILTDIPLSTLEAGDDYSPALVQEYAKKDTPFPAIIMDSEGNIRDGNHRVAAAKLRGDSAIKAYVPIDTYEPKQAGDEGDAVSEMFWTDPNAFSPTSALLKTANTFPTFDQFVKEEGGIPKLLDNLGEHTWNEYEAEMDLDGTLGLSEKDKGELLEKRAYEGLASDYENVVWEFKSWHFPMEIYREITLPAAGIKALQTQGIGVAWSWDEGSAEAHWGQFRQGHSKWLLKAVVNEDAIDWKMTILLNIDPVLGSNEKELRLKDGAKITMVAYKQTDNDKWTKPKPMVVTAALTPEDKEKIETLGGGYVIEEAEVGNYDLALIGTDLIPNFYQIGMQRHGLSMADPQQQMEKQPMEKFPVDWRQQVKDMQAVVDKWLDKYGRLYTASHNPEKTAQYIKLLKRLGYHVGEETIESHGVELTVPYISKTAGSKLNPVQRVVLEHMKDGKPIIRFPGGFWIVDTPAGKDKWGVPLDAKGGTLWHTGVQTIRAMEKRGWIQRTNKWPEEWRDERTITNEGLTALQMPKTASAADMHEALREYAKNVLSMSSDLDAIYLVGSAATIGEGHDTDLLYDFGTLPLDETNIEETVEELLQDQPGIDLDSYDTFVRVNGRYFHVSNGAGRAVVENTEYGQAQAGRPMLRLAAGLPTIWYHGTPHADKVVESGVLKPGQKSLYQIDLPRHNAIYITSDRRIAETYAESDLRPGHSEGGVVVVEVRDTSKLIPDEDTIHDILAENAQSRYTKGVQDLWFRSFIEESGTYYQDRGMTPPATFDDAWKHYRYHDIDNGDPNAHAEEMKATVDYIVAHDPALAKNLIIESRKAAYLGSLPVIKIAKAEKKAHWLLKTAGIQLPTLDETFQWAVDSSIADAIGDWDKIEIEAETRANSSGTPWNQLSEKDKEGLRDTIGYEHLQADWVQAERALQALTFPLVVYRGIAADSIKEIDFSEVGTYWSHNEKNAYVEKELAAVEKFHGRKIIILRGVIMRPSDVNWIRTGWVALQVPEEEEIDVKPGTQIQIDGWKFKGETKWRKPTVKSVVASEKTADSPQLSIQELVEQFKREEPEEIEYGNERDNCGTVAAAFSQYAVNHGFDVERVMGEFQFDKPDTDVKSFKKHERWEMEDEGLDFYSEEDRLAYIQSHGFEDAFSKGLHYWNEYRGEIIDLSGEAQFVASGLAADLNPNRYFKKKTWNYSKTADSPQLSPHRQTEYPESSNGWALQEDRREGEFGINAPTLKELAPEGDLEKLDAVNDPYDSGVTHGGGTPYHIRGASAPKMPRTEFEGDPDKMAAQDSPHKRWHLKNGTTEEGYKELLLAFHRWKGNNLAFLLEARNNPASDIGRAYSNEKRLTRMTYAEPVTLFRGIKGTQETPGRPLQSWTDSQKQATWWAGKGGKVLSRIFPPDQIVASYQTNSNVSAAEREFIVDAWRPKRGHWLLQTAVKKHPKDFSRDQWNRGNRAWFEYHCYEGHDSCDAQLWYHSHQEVTILGEADADGSSKRMPGSAPEERAENGTPRVYRIRFTDGQVFDAAEDELMTDRKGFYRPNPPKPKTVQGHWLLQAAERGVWYHGTSIKNLRSIMAEGLIPEGKKKNWDTDPDAGIHTPSREAYGGIYVTQNLMTATGSVRDDNGPNGTGIKLVVCMELQPQTFFLDEDSVVSSLNAPIQHISDSQYHVSMAYIAATQPNVGPSWTTNIGEFKKAYIAHVMENYEYKFKSQEQEMHPDLKSRLKGLVADTWLPALGRLAAHFAKDMKDYDVKKAWSQVFTGQWDETPPKDQVFPSVAEAEEDFRKHAEQITRTMRQLAYNQQNFRATARVTTPIGYSGSNHILAVVEIRDGNQHIVKEGDKSIVPMIVYYGEIPEDFWAQWRERFGYQVTVTQAGQEKAAAENEPMLDEEVSHEKWRDKVGAERLTLDNLLDLHDEIKDYPLRSGKLAPQKIEHALKAQQEKLERLLNGLMEYTSESELVASALLKAQEYLEKATHELYKGDMLSYAIAWQDGALTELHSALFALGYGERKSQGKLGATKLPKYLYHGTERDNLPNIMEKGLSPEFSDEHVGGIPQIYLAGDQYTAENYGGMKGSEADQWVILQIDTSALDESLLFPDDYDFPDLWSMGRVPKSILTRYTNAGSAPWWVSLKYADQVAYRGIILPQAISEVKPKFHQSAGAATSRITGKGWLLEDGTFEPCLQDEEHWEAAIRLGLVPDLGISDEEAEELDLENGGAANAMDSGYIRIDEGPGNIALDAIWDSEEIRKLMAKCIRENPQLYRVDIEFHRPKYSHVDNLSPDQAIQYLADNTVPKVRKGASAMFGWDSNLLVETVS